MDLSKTGSVFIGRDFLLLISKAPGPRREPGTKKKKKKKKQDQLIFCYRDMSIRIKTIGLLKKEKVTYKFVCIPVPEGFLCAWNCSGRHFTLCFLNSPGSEG